jgi:hypothetical protein
VNSLYDLFIWQHHYAAKNNNDDPTSDCKSWYYFQPSIIYRSLR